MTGNESPRILCIEDDYVTARLLQKRLIRAGFRVDMASKPSDGLAMLQSREFDLMCIDHQLPGMTGIEAISKLKSEDRLLPTVMITGAGSEAVAVQAMKLGVMDYVLKDSEGRFLELLPSVIERALRQGRLMAEKRAAEDALEKANRDLENRVLERTAELQRTTEALRKEIAERERVEKETQTRNEFLNSVLESLGHPFMVINADDYTISMANSSAGATLKLGEVTCCSLMHGLEGLCHPQAADCPVRIVKESRKPFVTEHMHLRSDDRSFPVEIHAYPLFDRDGEVSQVIQFCIDISARKQAESTVQELLTMFSKLVQNIPTGIMILQYQPESELFLVNSNPEAARITGITKEKWRGQELEEIWPAAGLKGLTRAFLNTMRTGEIFRTEEVEYTRADYKRSLRLSAFAMTEDLLGVCFEEV